jgi:Transcriptional activator of glycolytic enzymes
MLSPTPRTLAELWKEYQFGIGGSKPAKDWSSTERGNTRQGIKQKYYRRKMVWLTIEKLMERGHTRDAAINKIRSAYGWRCSVTQIINFIIANHQNGGHGHPNLIDLTPYLRTGGRRVRANV